MTEASALKAGANKNAKSGGKKSTRTVVTSVQPVAGESKLVDVTEIKVMTQARTDFGDMEELAASVRQSGILQPLLVRPNPTGFYADVSSISDDIFYVYNRNGNVISGPFYSKGHVGNDTPAQAKAKAQAEANRLNGGAHLLVAGERRLRAATIAGLTRVPVIVREFDDQGARLAQVEENLQRRDLRPVEEALAFRQLAEFKELQTVKAVAERVGKSEEYVGARWLLLNLIEEAQKLVDAGKLPLAHANFIARLGVESQPKALEMAFMSRWDGKRDVTDYDRPIGFENFKNKATASILRNLSTAPWPLDRTFDPAPKGCAASCAVCPNNTAREGSMFDTGKQALCANAVGFQNKTQMWFQVKAEEIKRDTGKEVPFVANAYGLKSAELKRRGLPSTTLTLEAFQVVDRKATKCASVEAAIVVEGYVGDGGVGHLVNICRDPKCKDHAAKPGSSVASRTSSDSYSSTPKKSPKEIRDRKQELFDLKVNEPVRIKALVEATKAVTWKTLDRACMNKIALMHYARVRTHTMKTVQEVFKQATGVALPDGRLDDKGNVTSTRLVEIVRELKQDQLAQFMLLCSVAQLGENEYMNHRQPQAALRAFVEGLGVNYALLDAEQRVALAANKYRPRHEEHLAKVRDGKADVKDAPKVYEVDDDPRPKSEASSAGQSTGTNSSKEGGRGPKSSKVSSSDGRVKKKAATTKAASSSKSKSSRGAGAPPVKPTAPKSSKGKTLKKSKA